jgi:hypothetical protein
MEGSGLPYGLSGNPCLQTTATEIDMDAVI